MAVNKICDGDTLCAIHVTGDEWSPGLNFFSDDGDFVQVGTWNYAAGKNLQQHTHLKAERQADITQEVVFVRQGRMNAEIFGLDQRKLADVLLESGDFLIALRGGHGYQILEDDTQVLEIKNGPYPGAERDRIRF